MIYVKCIEGIEDRCCYGWDQEEGCHERCKLLHDSMFVSVLLSV